MLLRLLAVTIPLLIPVIIYYTISERADQWLTRKIFAVDLPSDRLSRIYITLQIICVTVITVCSASLIFQLIRWIVTGN